MKEKKLYLIPMEMHSKPKPPIVPRCLCSSFLHWCLQIRSPSRVTDLMFTGRDQKANKYFQEVRSYIGQLLRWKINKRICTRNEWHEYRKYYRNEEENK